MIRPPNISPGNTEHRERVKIRFFFKHALFHSCVCECVYQPMCFTPPSRCCFSSINLRIAFFRSRTVAFCTTTIAMRKKSSLYVLDFSDFFKSEEYKRLCEFKKHVNRKQGRFSTYASLHRLLSRLLQSSPGRTPKQSESWPPPESPEDRYFFIFLSAHKFTWSQKHAGSSWMFIV